MSSGKRQRSRVADAVTTGTAGLLLGLSHRTVEDREGTLYSCGRTLFRRADSGPTPLCRSLDGWRYLCVAALALAVVLAVDVVRRRHPSVRGRLLCACQVVLSTVGVWAWDERTLSADVTVRAAFGGLAAGCLAAALTQLLASSPATPEVLQP